MKGRSLFDAVTAGDFRGAAATHPDEAHGAQLRMQRLQAEIDAPQRRTGLAQPLAKLIHDPAQVTQQPAFADQPVENRLDLPVRNPLMNRFCHQPARTAPTSSLEVR